MAGKNLCGTYGEALAKTTKNFRNDSDSIKEIYSTESHRAFSLNGINQRTNDNSNRFVKFVSILVGALVIHIIEFSANPNPNPNHYPNTNTNPYPNPCPNPYPNPNTNTNPNPNTLPHNPKS